MAHTSDTQTYVGQPMKRREDRRLLLGAGKFVDDLKPAGALSVIFVRSPHGHARIARLDVEAARKAPGVVAVVTGDEVRHLAPMPVNRAIPDMKIPPHPIIAEGAVRATGEPVAAIAAESAAEAWDAAELIEVEYDTLPAVSEPEAALAAGSPVLCAEVPGNRSFRRVLRGGDPDSAFARAAYRVTLRVAQERISAVAMEPRMVAATFDAVAGELTLWVSCQSPFRIRGEVARLLGLHESQVRVIAPDVGGGFGVKTGPYREEVLLAWLAVRLGRPLRWASTRREDFETTNQARGSVCENPLLAEGQLHGGLAQGLGQTLMERLVYDERGQLLTGTLMDYAVPRADDVPPVTIVKMHTPSPRNPLGAKGLGEAGCIAIPPAVVNAAVDALAPFGVTHVDMPLTHDKLWRAMRS